MGYEDSPWRSAEVRLDFCLPWLEREDLEERSVVMTSIRSPDSAT